MSKPVKEASEVVERELSDSELDGASGGFVIYGGETKAGPVPHLFGDGSVRFVSSSVSPADSQLGGPDT